VVEETDVDERQQEQERGRVPTLTNLIEAVKTIMRSERATEDLTLERRFARVEAMIDGLQSAGEDGFEGVHRHLNRLDAAVAEQKAWIGGHEVKHALVEGKQLGSAGYTAQLIAVVTVCAAVAGVLVNIVMNFLER
jgi:hypothetical protein